MICKESLQDSNTFDAGWPRCPGRGGGPGRTGHTRPVTVACFSPSIYENCLPGPSQEKKPDGSSLTGHLASQTLFEWLGFWAAARGA